MQAIDPRIPKDHATMMLAHPQRCAVCLPDTVLGVWKRVLSAHTWAALEARFKEPGGFTADILASLLDEPGHSTLAYLTEALADSDAGTEMGSAFSLMLYLRQAVSPQPHFLIDDALVELLEQTDISDDVPVSVLSLPYPRCYLELGKARKVSAVVPNLVSGMHSLEGAYLEQANSPRKGPGLYVMLTGSPLGHDNAMDDATSSLFIPTSNPNQSLREALAGARAQSGELAKSLGLKATPQEFFEDEINALMLIVKALLYIGLPQARRALHKDLSQALAAAKSKKNPSKRDKALQEARRLSDYILVTAAPAERNAPSADTGRSVKPHWRRGHYRMQRFGPQLAQQKLVFIQPTLVGEAAVASAPSYRVKG